MMQTSITRKDFPIPWFDRFIDEYNTNKTVNDNIYKKRLLGQLSLYDNEIKEASKTTTWTSKFQALSDEISKNPQPTILSSSIEQKLDDAITSYSLLDIVQFAADIKTKLDQLKPIVQSKIDTVNIPETSNQYQKIKTLKVDKGKETEDLRDVIDDQIKRNEKMYCISEISKKFGSNHPSAEESLKDTIFNFLALGAIDLQTRMEQKVSKAVKDLDDILLRQTTFIANFNNNQTEIDQVRNQFDLIGKQLLMIEYAIGSTKQVIDTTGYKTLSDIVIAILEFAENITTVYEMTSKMNDIYENLKTSFALITSKNTVVLFVPPPQPQTKTGTNDPEHIYEQVQSLLNGPSTKNTLVSSKLTNGNSFVTAIQTYSKDIFVLFSKVEDDSFTYIITNLGTFTTDNTKVFETQEKTITHDLETHTGEVDKMNDQYVIFLKQIEWLRNIVKQVGNTRRLEEYDDIYNVFKTDHKVIAGVKSVYTLLDEMYKFIDNTFEQVDDATQQNMSFCFQRLCLLVQEIQKNVEYFQGVILSTKTEATTSTYAGCVDALFVTLETHVSKLIDEKVLFDVFINEVVETWVMLMFTTNLPIPKYPKTFKNQIWNIIEYLHAISMDTTKQKYDDATRLHFKNALDTYQSSFDSGKTKLEKELSTYANVFSNPKHKQELMDVLKQYYEPLSHKINEWLNVVDNITSLRVGCSSPEKKYFFDYSEVENFHIQYVGLKKVQTSISKGLSTIRKLVLDLSVPENTKKLFDVSSALVGSIYGNNAYKEESTEIGEKIKHLIDTKTDMFAPFKQFLIDWKHVNETIVNVFSSVDAKLEEVLISMNTQIKQQMIDPLFLDYESKTQPSPKPTDADVIKFMSMQNGVALCYLRIYIWLCTKGMVNVGQEITKTLYDQVMELSRSTGVSPIFRSIHDLQKDIPWTPLQTKIVHVFCDVLNDVIQRNANVITKFKDVFDKATQQINENAKPPSVIGSMFSSRNSDINMYPYGIDLIIQGTTAIETWPSIKKNHVVGFDDLKILMKMCLLSPVTRDIKNEIASFINDTDKTREKDKRSKLVVALFEMCTDSGVDLISNYSDDLKLIDYVIVWYGIKPYQHASIDECSCYIHLTNVLVILHAIHNDWKNNAKSLFKLTNNVYEWLANVKAVFEYIQTEIQPRLKNNYKTESNQFKGGFLRTNERLTECAGNMNVRILAESVDFLISGKLSLVDIQSEYNQNWSFNMEIFLRIDIELLSFCVLGVLDELSSTLTEKGYYRGKESFRDEEDTDEPITPLKEQTQTVDPNATLVATSISTPVVDPNATLVPTSTSSVDPNATLVATSISTPAVATSTATPAIGPNATLAATSTSSVNPNATPVKPKRMKRVDTTPMILDPAFKARMLSIFTTIKLYDWVNYVLTVPQIGKLAQKTYLDLNNRLGETVSSMQATESNTFVFENATISNGTTPPVVVQQPQIQSALPPTDNMETYILNWKNNFDAYIPESSIDSNRIALEKATNDLLLRDEWEDDYMNELFLHIMSVKPDIKWETLEFEVDFYLQNARYSQLDFANKTKYNALLKLSKKILNVCDFLIPTDRKNHYSTILHNNLSSQQEKIRQVSEYLDELLQIDENTLDRNVANISNASNIYTIELRQNINSILEIGVNDTIQDHAKSSLKRLYNEWLDKSKKIETLDKDMFFECWWLIKNALVTFATINDVFGTKSTTEEILKGQWDIHKIDLIFECMKITSADDFKQHVTSTNSLTLESWYIQFTQAKKNTDGNNAILDFSASFDLFTQSMYDVACDEIDNNATELNVKDTKRIEKGHEFMVKVEKMCSEHVSKSISQIVNKVIDVSAKSAITSQLQTHSTQVVHSFLVDIMDQVARCLTGPVIHYIRDTYDVDTIVTYKADDWNFWRQDRPSPIDLAFIIKRLYELVWTTSVNTRNANATQIFDDFLKATTSLTSSSTYWTNKMKNETFDNHIKLQSADASFLSDIVTQTSNLGVWITYFTEQLDTGDASIQTSLIDDWENSSTDLTFVTKHMSHLDNETKELFNKLQTAINDTKAKLSSIQAVPQQVQAVPQVLQPPPLASAAITIPPVTTPPTTPQQVPSMMPPLSLDGNPVSDPSKAAANIAHPVTNQYKQATHNLDTLVHLLGIAVQEANRVTLSTMPTYTVKIPKKEDERTDHKWAFLNNAIHASTKHKITLDIQLLTENFFPGTSTTSVIMDPGQVLFVSTLLKIYNQVVIPLGNEIWIDSGISENIILLTHRIATNI